MGVTLGPRWVVEDHELAAGLEGGGEDEGLAVEDTRVGDEVARGGVVSAIEHKVVLGDYRVDCLGCYVGAVGAVCEGRVKAASVSAGEGQLREGWA